MAVPNPPRPLSIRTISAGYAIHLSGSEGIRINSSNLIPTLSCLRIESKAPRELKLLRLPASSKLEPNPSLPLTTTSQSTSNRRALLRSGTVPAEAAFLAMAKTLLRCAFFTRTFDLECCVTALRHERRSLTLPCCLPPALSS